MVSVRRGWAAAPAVGGRLSSSSSKKSSCCSLRNALLLFIAVQAVNIFHKVVLSSREIAKPDMSSTSVTSLHDVLRKTRSKAKRQQQHPKMTEKKAKDLGPKAVEVEHQVDEGPHRIDEHEEVEEEEDEPRKQEDEEDVELDKQPVIDVKRRDASVSKHSKTTKQQQKEQPDVLTQHGSGPAKLGYVVDLVDEREQAKFRRLSLPDDMHYTSRAKEVARQLGKQQLAPCEYSLGRKLLQHEHCREDPDMILMAFNGAPFPRYFCGQVIAPGSALELNGDDGCNVRDDPVHLFSHANEAAPPLDGAGMPAIVIRHGHGGGPVEAVECDIPCEADESDDITGGVTKMYIEGTDWEIMYTMEDPYYKAEAKIERTNYRRDVYYATTSLISEVPLSFFDSEKYGLASTKKVSWKRAANKATYLIDKDCTSGRRHKWFAAVSAVFDVESYGSCHRNTDLKKSESIKTMEGRIELMKKNRIVLAFEAGNEKDHITEIVWEALLSGAVPAINGATNLESRLPPNSAIYASNFNNWDRFAAYVKEVSENEELWKSYHKWREDDRALERFESTFKFTETEPECRMCRWAYAKMYGLGWNHTQQVVQDNVIPRTLCLGTKDKLVTKPFSEVWVDAGTKKSGGRAKKEKCTSTTSKAEIETDSYNVERDVVEHDGVIDMFIRQIDQSASQHEVVLRLVFDKVRNSDGAYFRDTHTLVTNAIRTPAVSSASIQDGKAKVTVLANWETEITSPEEGVIEVVVKGSNDAMEEDEVRRIRIITEDMSELHDKMTEFFPSTFGKLMTYDFIDPLELYYEA